jgi:hypothetical protein
VDLAVVHLDDLMATRLYLSNAAPAYTPPTVRGAWVAVSALVRALGDKAGAAATAQKLAASTTSPSAVGRWVSAPFTAAGALAGTVTWAFGALDSNSVPITWAHIFVTAGDTDTVRGTLLTNYNGGTAWPTTAAGVSSGAVALTSVTVAVGDRIVVELGASGDFRGTRNLTVNYGGTDPTDMTGAGDTAVTTHPGWFEFSAADPLFVAPVPVPVTRRAGFFALFPGGV